MSLGTSAAEKLQPLEQSEVGEKWRTEAIPAGFESSEQAIASLKRMLAGKEKDLFVVKFDSDSKSFLHVVGAESEQKAQAELQTAEQESQSRLSELETSAEADIQAITEQKTPEKTAVASSSVTEQPAPKTEVIESPVQAVETSAIAATAEMPWQVNNFEKIQNRLKTLSQEKGEGDKTQLERELNASSFELEEQIKEAVSGMEDRKKEIKTKLRKERGALSDEETEALKSEIGSINQRIEAIVSKMRALKGTETKKAPEAAEKTENISLNLPPAKPVATSPEQRFSARIPKTPSQAEAEEPAPVSGVHDTASLKIERNEVPVEKVQAKEAATASAAPEEAIITRNEAPVVSLRKEAVSLRTEVAEKASAEPEKVSAKPETTEEPLKKEEPKTEVSKKDGPEVEAPKKDGVREEIMSGIQEIVTQLDDPEIRKGAESISAKLERLNKEERSLETLNSMELVGASGSHALDVRKDLQRKRIELANKELEEALPELQALIAKARERKASAKEPKAPEKAPAASTVEVSTPVPKGVEVSEPVKTSESTKTTDAPVPSPTKAPEIISDWKANQEASRKLEERLAQTGSAQAPKFHDMPEEPSGLELGGRFEQASQKTFYEKQKKDLMKVGFQEWTPLFVGMGGMGKEPWSKLDDVEKSKYYLGFRNELDNELEIIKLNDELTKVEGKVKAGEMNEAEAVNLRKSIASLEQFRGKIKAEISDLEEKAVSRMGAAPKVEAKPTKTEAVAEVKESKIETLKTAETKKEDEETVSEKASDKLAESVLQSLSPRPAATEGKPFAKTTAEKLKKNPGFIRRNIGWFSFSAAWAVAKGASKLGEWGYRAAFSLGNFGVIKPFEFLMSFTKDPGSWLNKKGAEFAAMGKNWNKDKPKKPAEKKEE